MNENASVDELRMRIAALERLGSTERPFDASSAEELTDELEAVFNSPVFSSLTFEEQGAALYRAHLVFSRNWHSSGLRLINSIEAIGVNLFSCDAVPLNILCIAYDLLYFLHWCWGTNVYEQASFGHNVVRPFAAAIRRRTDAAQVPANPSPRVRRVGYLAEFISPGPGNAIAIANRVILEALASDSSCYPPVLYAWLFHDDDTLQQYRDLGITVHAITGDTTVARIDEVRRLIAQDEPDVLITDMNAALPTALFASRSAPIQIFYQFGMPVWPVAEVDGVLSVWSFSQVHAGLTDRYIKELTVPYDVTRFAQVSDAKSVERECAKLPSGRLIGTYGRLSKVSPGLIEAIAIAIEGVPDVSVVLGGSGDASIIREIVARRGLSNRFAIIEGFVDGHAWGGVLDVFLDTFPQPGGASCLEMIARGKPVVSYLTPDAANLARKQRVSRLVARNDREYAAILRRLLTDPSFYAKMCAATIKLSVKIADMPRFRAELLETIDALRSHSSAPQRMRSLSGWAVRTFNRIVR